MKGTPMREITARELGEPISLILDISVRPGGLAMRLLRVTRPYSAVTGKRKATRWMLVAEWHLEQGGPWGAVLEDIVAGVGKQIAADAYLQLAWIDPGVQ